MPSLGAPELIIILVLVVIVFGVGKLPEIGSAMGKGIREFRAASSDETPDMPHDASKPKDTAA
jgi:sec-independent protein translocase protein TatA